MAVDIDKVAFHSGYNAFKNNGVHRASLSLPDYYPAMTEQSVEYTFTMQEDTDFVQLLVFATNYSKPFIEGIYGVYINRWEQVEQSNDYLLRANNGSIYYFRVEYKVNGKQVTVKASTPKFSQAFTVASHVDVPVAFVEYTLAR